MIDWPFAYIFLHSDTEHQKKFAVRPFGDSFAGSLLTFDSHAVTSFAAEFETGLSIALDFSCFFGFFIALSFSISFMTTRQASIVSPDHGKAVGSSLDLTFFPFRFTFSIASS